MESPSTQFLVLTKNNNSNIKDNAGNNNNDDGDDDDDDGDDNDDDDDDKDDDDNNMNYISNIHLEKSRETSHKMQSGRRRPAQHSHRLRILETKTTKCPKLCSLS